GNVFVDDVGFRSALPLPSNTPSWRRPDDTSRTLKPTLEGLNILVLRMAPFAPASRRARNTMSASLVSSWSQAQSTAGASDDRRRLSSKNAALTEPCGMIGRSAELGCASSVPTAPMFGKLAPRSKSSPGGDSSVAFGSSLSNHSATDFAVRSMLIGNWARYSSSSAAKGRGPPAKTNGPVANMFAGSPPSGREPTTIDETGGSLDGVVMVPLATTAPSTRNVSSSPRLPARMTCVCPRTTAPGLDAIVVADAPSPMTACSVPSSSTRKANPTSLPVDLVPSSCDVLDGNDTSRTTMATTASDVASWSGVNSAAAALETR